MTLTKPIMNSIGAFYKNDIDEGFAITITAEALINNKTLEDLNFQLIEVNEIAHLKFMKDQGLSEQEMADIFFYCLEKELLPKLKVFPRMPTTEEIFDFMMKISWLTNHNFIVNNNYNGMLYSYQIK